MEIRDAVSTDMTGVAEIYNDAVVNTTAIWNEVAVDTANRVEWLTGRNSAGYPVLVAVEGDIIAGYASYGDWRAWDGYRHTIEHSIYVHSDYRGQGIGKKLLEARQTHHDRRN